MSARQGSAHRTPARRVPARRVPTRRGVLMLAVLVTLAVAALVAGGLLAASESEHAGLAAMRDRTQQRAIAWSGCQAVAALLSSQRQSVADGDVPEVPEEILLFEMDGSQAVARLLPLGPSGERLVPEGAKFPLAGLDPALLEATGVVDGAAAAAAVAGAKDSDAIEAIVRPDAGLPADKVLGPVAAGIAAGVRKLQDSGAGGGSHGALQARVRPLVVADVATPFSAQRALGSGAGGIAPRVPVGRWSAEAMAAIDARAGSGSAARMRDALKNEAPADQGALVRAMRLANVPTEKWSAVLDAVVAGKSAVEHGQVDLSSAPEEVLRAIPAIGADRAARIVQARTTLAAGERSQLAWPVTQGIMTPEEFEAAAPRLSSRSWLWRARVATGTVHPQQDGAMRGIEVWEVVVDLAEDPPRFASIRDCTLLPVAAALAEQDRVQRDRQGDAARAHAADARDDGADDAAADGAALARGAADAPYEPSVPVPGPAAVPDDPPADAGTRSTAGGRPALQRKAWTSRASEQRQQSEDQRLSDEDVQRADQLIALQREQSGKPADPPPDATPAEGADAATGVSKDKFRKYTWTSMADRQRAEREERHKELNSLDDRLKAERDQRQREREQERQKQWSSNSLADRERKRREERDAAELARRGSLAQQAKLGPTDRPATQGAGTDDLPATDAPDASSAGDSGKDAERSDSSGTSAGGLSGRWRRRGDQGP
jgi:hypothetical protein